MALADCWRRELLAGAVAGLVQDIIMHPFDTLRTRLDVGTLGHVDAVSSLSGRRLPADGLGPFAAFRRSAESTFRTEGLAGFYGGYAVQLCFTMPLNAIYFSTQSGIRRALGNNDVQSSLWKDSAAGLGAQAVASTVWTPLDVVKERLQVKRAHSRERSVKAVVRDVVNSQGLRGLWVGYWSGIFVWGPFSAIVFGVNEILKVNVFGRSPPNLEGSSSSKDRGSSASVDGEAFRASELFAGICAALVASAATQPLDTVRTRAQTGLNVTAIVASSSEGNAETACQGPAIQQRKQQQQQGRKQLCTFSIFRHILDTEGLAGFCRGGVARALWLGPGFGLTLCVFQGMQRILA